MAQTIQEERWRWLKPNINEDEEKFYQQNRFRNRRDLETKIRAWNKYYNNLEHCGLGGKTPNEVLLR